jgi:ThiF family
VTPEAALARTTRLINEEYFGGAADTDAIAAGLLRTTVRLVADEKNASTLAGQAALVTAFQLTARMGIGVELILPELPLARVVPPLRASMLRAALVDLGADLIPGLTIRETAVHAEITFVLGDSAGDNANREPMLAVDVSDFGCRIDIPEEPGSRIESDVAYGGLAAGAAVAALALDRALPNIEATAERAITSQPRPSPGPPVDIDLRAIFPDLPPTPPSISRVDVISGGAVTNGFIYALLWLLVQCEHLEIADDDCVDWHNLNRCTQFRASDVTSPKVTALERSGTDSLRITGRPERFHRPEAGQPSTLADDVVVGVDRIEARWWVQEAWPKNLYVAATSNRESVVTTHHAHGACAGCAHPQAAPPPDEIPTISFVSLWAGLLQACALLTENTHSASRRLTVFPFALGEPSWASTAELQPIEGCAIQCQASTTPPD